MKSLDIVEDFLVLKSLFLLLQIFFELRHTSPAWPVVTYIEMKLKKQEEIIQQKHQMKSTTFEDQPEASSSQEESKTSDHQPFGQEILDETVLTKNSFSIINAAFIRKHAVSPKNMNINEYRILLQSYKAMFLIL